MKYIFNPMTESITVDIDKLGDNPQQFTLEAGAIEEFKDGIADIIRDAIADKMLWANYPSDKNRDKRMKELHKLIEVTPDES
ncbi:hypothetical protein LCGC14_0995890 [marine sediment metagenome]|uniref:Uncharacterized protein n=1 Tax=marine sediment metagenome TaxID=412755 RepID=A0A0F9NQX0_9ZZZZ